MNEKNWFTNAFVLPNALWKGTKKSITEIMKKRKRGWHSNPFGSSKLSAWLSGLINSHLSGLINTHLMIYANWMIEKCYTSYFRHSSFFTFPETFVFKTCIGNISCWISQIKTKLRTFPILLSNGLIHAAFPSEATPKHVPCCSEPKSQISPFPQPSM